MNFEGAGAASACNTTHLVFDFGPSKSFMFNCQLYASFDIVVAVHGAGMANLWCATPGVAIVEIVTSEHANVSMYTPLARKMGLTYCIARTVQGSFDTPVQ